MAQTQRRRDGRPVETVPAGATTMPPPPPQGTGGSGVTPAVAGGLAAAVPAGQVVAVAGLPSVAAVSLSAASIMQGFERFLDARNRVVESQVDLLLEQEYGQQVDEGTRLEIIDGELTAEQAYRAKVRARLDRDLPKVLSITDAAVREAELRKVLDRERRYADAREEAIAVRSLGAAEARLVREASPQGAYWKLSPLVREHTLDCLAMGGKVWPWTVLEAYRPPLHVGCACELVAIADAQAQRLPGADMTAHPEQAFGAMAVQEAAFDPVELTDEIEALELRVLEAWDQRFGSGTTKGGQFRPKRGGMPGRPTGLRVLGRRSRGLELLHAADRATRGFPQSGGDTPPVLTRRRGMDVQTGDHVAVGGEWHRVAWTNHERSPGYVELEGHGPVLLDPHKEFDVRVRDHVAEPGGGGGGEHRPPVAVGRDEHKTAEALRRGDHFTAAHADYPEIKTTHEALSAPRYDSKTGKVHVRTLTIGGGSGRVQEHSFDPAHPVVVHTAGRPTPKGLEAADPQTLASFHGAVRTEALATERDLALRNIRHVTPERARYDWRAKLSELDVPHDLSQEHVDRLERERKAATQERVKAQTAVYRDLVEKGIAYDVQDHSGRLKDKPYEVRPRPETLGVIGGEQFARETGASLRMARYKTRENAQKVVDELHARESQRLREADAGAPVAGGLRGAGGAHAEHLAAIEKWRGRLRERNDAHTAKTIRDIAQREAFAGDTPKTAQEEWAKLQAEAQKVLDAAGKPAAPDEPNYGGQHGLPELKRWPDDARFELRYGDNASLVMWDRQEQKPYAVWDSGYDVGAIAKAVDEQNIATSSSGQHATTPEHAPNPDRPTREQIDALSRLKQPDGAAELAPGIRYDPELARAREDANGLTVGPGFFKMRDRRLRQQVIFRHLGRELAGGLNADEMGRLGDLGNVDALYHGLNDEKAYKRVEAIEPEKAAVLAEAARRLGLPLHPKVDEWLGQRGAEPEHSLARGGGEPDTPDMIDAKALAGEIVGERTAHFTLPQRGYLMAGGEKGADGRFTAMTFHNPKTGLDVHVELDGTGQVTKATAKRNATALPDDLRARIAGDTSTLSGLHEAGWDWTALGAGHTPAGDGYHRLVNPDGRGMIVYEAANGELDPEKSYGYTPTAEAVGRARATAVQMRPQEFLEPGRTWDEALGAQLSRAGWAGSLQSAGVRAGDTLDVDPKTGAPPTRLRAVMPEGVDEVRMAKRDGDMLTVHLKDGKIVAAGYGNPDPLEEPLQGRALTSIVTKDVHDAAKMRLEKRRLETRRRGEAEAGAGAQGLLDFAKANAETKAGKKIAAPDEIVRSLTTKEDGTQRTTTEVVRHLQAAGFDVADARRTRSAGSSMVNYRLRGPDGSTVELRGGNTYADQSVNRMHVIPSPQGGGERRRHPAGEAWKNADELYRDALGRADEQAARHNAVAHVTSVYDGPVGRAVAHHEWNGAIVMGKGSRARQRIDEYLKKRAAGDATQADHVDFYDVLSTLQHEIHHGIGAAGNQEGGLAFGSKHYRPKTQPWEVAMEEALTEETARLETLDWLRAQGMTDTLQAVKRMGKTDYRYLGSYTAYRERMRKVLDAARVPEQDRKALLYRMKFEMTPDERMHHLDAAIASHDDTHAQRLARVPGYSPTKVMLGGSTKNFGGRGPSDFRPIVDDPLNDVALPPRPGDMADVGDHVTFPSGAGTIEGRVTTRSDRHDRLIVEDASGASYGVQRGNVLSVSKNGGVTVQSPPASASAPRLKNGASIDTGMEVMVDSTQGGDPQRGEVVEVGSGDYVKVRTEDGLELWRSLDRLRFPGKAELKAAVTA